MSNSDPTFDTPPVKPTVPETTRSVVEVEKLTIAICKVLESRMSKGQLKMLAPDIRAILHNHLTRE